MTIHDSFGLVIFSLGSCIFIVVLENHGASLLIYFLNLHMISNLQYSNAAWLAFATGQEKTLASSKRAII